MATGKTQKVKEFKNKAKSHHIVSPIKWGKPL